MSLRVGWSLLVLVAVTGCAGGPSAPLTIPGDPTASPAVHILPSLPRERSELSETMRFGWLLAEESLGIEEPALPQGLSGPEIFAWNEDTLSRWLHRKSQTAAAARRELDRAADERPDQRVMAGAIVGLVYEDIAAFLLRIPPPEELFDDPEILYIYREVRDANAAPYRNHARVAYRACATNALTVRDMAHWHRFCAARADQLPEPDWMPPVEGTEVTVYRVPDDL
ncbi:MAG: hypothetical protein AAGF12_02650 [Myxococcota bacterium]